MLLFWWSHVIGYKASTERVGQSQDCLPTKPLDSGRLPTYNNGIAAPPMSKIAVAITQIDHLLIGKRRGNVYSLITQEQLRHASLAHGLNTVC